MKHASSKTHALPYCMHGVFAKAAMKDADHGSTSCQFVCQHACFQTSIWLIKTSPTSIDK